MYDAIVIGNINIETNIDAVKIPRSDDFEMVNIYERIGGNAIDISVLCSHFGLRTSMVSSIGMDASGVLPILEKSKIDYSHLIVSETKTGKCISINLPGETSTFFFKGANKHLIPYGIEHNYLRSAKLIHICPSNAEILHSIPEKAGDVIISCQFDPTYPMESLSQNLNFLFLNSADALNASGKEDLLEAGKTFLQYGPRNVIINDRGRRAIVIRPEDQYEVVVTTDKAFDATDYEDAFYSGFIYRFVKTLNLKSSLSFGLAFQYFSHKKGNRLLFMDVDDIEDKMYAILRSNNE
ncbi:MAG: hypothetical protein JW825_04790 [Candidatus Methanofastidiosa archaeon]|nr:hypothetical protein [Candidatus Methanofastidiosa archaeon]